MIYRCDKTLGCGVEDGLILADDFSVRCFQREHVYYAAMGFVFIGLYVLGIPAAMFVLLFR